MILSLCVECGPNVRLDSEGCCFSCGGNAIGTWLDRVTGDRRQYDHAVDEEATIESVRYVRNVLAGAVAALNEDVNRAVRKREKVRGLLVSLAEIALRLADAECDSEAEESIKKIMGEADIDVIADEKAV